MNFRKHIFNPFVWLVITALVFVGLLVTNTPADSVIAPVLFLPCFTMTILAFLGVFGKWIK